MSDNLADRSIIVFSLVIILLVSIAPWLTGGKDPLAIAITAVALLLGSILVWLQQGVLQVGDRWLGMWFGGLAVWAALSLIWTVNRYQSVMWLVYLVLGSLAFILANRLRMVPRFRQLILDGYIAISILMVGFGVWLYLTQSFSRLTSSFYWPNPAAAYLIPAIILLFEWGIGAWRYRVAGTIILIGFILTDSRGSLLALVVGTLLFVFIQRPKRAYWINLLFMVLIAYMMSILVVQLRTHIFHQTSSPTPGVRLTQLAEGTGSSASRTDRINYLKSSYEIWAAHPILGTGAGTYPTMHPLYQVRVISASSSAHNLYAQTLSELGLPGAILLVILLFRLLWVGLRASTGQDESMALVAGLLALFIHFGLDVDSQYLALVTLLAVYAGLTYIPVDRAARWTWLWAGAAAIVAAIAIGSNLSQTWADQGQASQDAGYYQDAAVAFGSAHAQLTYNPDTLTAEGINWYTQGVLQRNAADYRVALSLARQAEHQDPDDGQHYFLAARALRGLKDLSAAEKEYQMAIHLDPFYTHPDYYEDLAGLELQEIHSAQAIQTASAAISHYPLAVRQNRAIDPTVKGDVVNLYVTRATAEQSLGKNNLAQSDLATASEISHSQ